MDNFLFGLTFASAVGSGLIAGLFFAFSVCVMTVLARLPAAQGITVMQSINAVILNPLFLLVFMGTALASVILGIAACFKWGTAGAAYLLAGSVLYFVGVFLVTAVFNVPLNNALAGAAPGSSEGAALWDHYLSRWVPWNHIRTVAAIAALAAFIMAIRMW